MMNERRSLEWWISALEKYFEDRWNAGIRELLPVTPIGFPAYAMCEGKQVVHCKYSEEIILFEQCEWCGNKRLDKNDCCTACGANVEMK